jgi:tetratricopeptide (TPR) repeat protein
LLASTRARQLVEDGQLETALTYFDLVAPFAASPSGEMDMLTGQLALQLERPEDAARRFLAATCAATPTPDAFIKLGVTLLRLDRRAEAVGALEQGATRFPASAPLLYTLALAHLQDGMPAAAIARLEQLRDAHEAEADGALMADFYVTLGSAYDRAGRFDRAEAVFLECVERYPDAHEALNYLAYLWAERDIELERAEAFIERALDLQPDNAAYLDTKGWILYRRGRYEDALALVLAADQRLPGDPVILDHLGDLYDALDRRADAMACWRRSLEADPANTLVALKLEAYGDNPDRLIRRARRRLRREEQAP